MKIKSITEAAQQAAGLIQKAEYCVILTGAGISTPSGIPDFRSARSGLWTEYDPMEVASLTAFKQRPDKFFNWLHPLAQKILNANPNPAHEAISRIQHAGWIKSVITQNIDGLHQAAGSMEVIELHGSLTTLSCLTCRRTYPMQIFKSSFLESRLIPECSYCQSILKPDIVLFEELTATLYRCKF